MARILIVDDEPTLARALARAFRTHQVAVANSGEAALKAIAEDAFDAVICDLMMPSVTGMDVHRQLQSSDPALADKMVFMTGGDYTPEQTEFRKLIGDRCLQKPLDIAQLRKLVDLLIAQ